MRGVWRQTQPVMLVYSDVQVLLVTHRIATPGDSLLYKVWREADCLVVAVIWHITQRKLRMFFS